MSYGRSTKWCWTITRLGGLVLLLPIGIAAYDTLISLTWPVELQASSVMIHRTSVWAVAFGFDDNILVSACDELAIRRSDATKWLPPIVLKGHNRSVGRVRIAPAGDILASASWDGVVELWNMRTGENAATFDCAGGAQFAPALDFSRNGDVLAYVSNDTSIQLWNYRRAVPIVAVNSIPAAACDTMRAIGRRRSSRAAEKFCQTGAAAA